MKLAENLKEEHGKYVILKDDTYNAIISALKEKPLTQPGFNFADRQEATAYSSNNLKGYFLFTCQQNLLQRSIFGMNEGSSIFGEPAIISAQNINATTDASPFGLFTNLRPYNISDTYGLCRAINFYEPTLLSVSDVSNFPAVGMPCGPDLNTGGWGLSGKSFGCLCISLPNSDVGGDSFDNIWVIRTPDPAGVIGTIFGADVAAYNASTNTLGQGFIQLQYRNSQGVLVNAIGPNGASLILPVYNASANSAFKQGTLVKCICVINVGLVIIDSSNLVWGRAEPSNIPHFTSGLVSVYSGGPGQEFLDSTKTPYSAFNHGPEVVKDEWCFLTASGDKTIPYYIVQNEYGGAVLGQTDADTYAAISDSFSVKVNIYGGTFGSEYSFSTSIQAKLKNIVGAIPKGSWVVAKFLGPDATAKHGGWYIVASQRGNTLAGRVNGGNAGKDYAVDSTVKVRIYTGNGANTDSGLDVTCRILYGPVMEKERVQIEWTGDEFIITKGELDGGFEAQVLYDISKGGTGNVFVSGTLQNSQVQVDNITVSSKLGTVKTDKWVNVFRNRGGWRIVSAEC